MLPGFYHALLYESCVHINNTVHFGSPRDRHAILRDKFDNQAPSGHRDADGGRERLITNFGLGAHERAVPSCWNVSFVVLLVLDDGSTLGGLIQTLPAKTIKTTKLKPSPVMNSVRVADHTAADHPVAISRVGSLFPLGTSGDAFLKWRSVTLVNKAIAVWSYHKRD